MAALPLEMAALPLEMAVHCRWKWLHQSCGCLPVCTDPDTGNGCRAAAHSSSAAVNGCIRCIIVAVNGTIAAVHNAIAAAKDRAFSHEGMRGQQKQQGGERRPAAGGL
eukprot:772269-Rhodomonas_salina.1